MAEQRQASNLNSRKLEQSEARPGEGRNGAPRDAAELVVWAAVAEERATHMLGIVLADNPQDAVAQLAVGVHTTEIDPDSGNPSISVLTEHDIPLDVIISTAFEEGIANAPVACSTCMAPLVDEPRCRVCGFPCDKTLISALRQVSFESAYFGWTYRTEYEHQSLPGTGPLPPSRRLHLLPVPTSELTWLASIVVSGIVGNAAYDAIKAAITLARSRFGPTIRYYRPTGARSTGRLDPTNDDNILTFIKYVESYIQPFRESESDLHAVFTGQTVAKAIDLHFRLTGERLDPPGESNADVDAFLGALHPRARAVALSLGDIATKLVVLSMLVPMQTFKTASVWNSLVSSKKEEKKRRRTSKTPKNGAKKSKRARGNSESS